MDSGGLLLLSSSQVIAGNVSYTSALMAEPDRRFLRSSAPDRRIASCHASLSLPRRRCEAERFALAERYCLPQIQELSGLVVYVGQSKMTIHIRSSLFMMLAHVADRGLGPRQYRDSVSESPASLASSATTSLRTEIRARTIGPDEHSQGG